MKTTLQITLLLLLLIWSASCLNNEEGGDLVLDPDIFQTEEQILGALAGRYRCVADCCGQDSVVLNVLSVNMSKVIFEHNPDFCLGWLATTFTNWPAEEVLDLGDEDFTIQYIYSVGYNYGFILNLKPNQKAFEIFYGLDDSWGRFEKIE
ncbi:MAG: hypothetical protein KDD10_14570 [Phaeodactylibacter sp.]|nr:hypothetical protein [Phaeodactylibacter sp.]MCB9296203.1 hypothetical protein [Lewinellaceae bacterium]